MMNPAELSADLRRATSADLSRRRSTVALSLTAMGALAMVSLYQTGLIEHVSEPPLPDLDADKVDAAPGAYAALHTPDAVLGLGSYAVTLGLAAMGGAHRARTRPWLPLALAGKAAIDSANAGRLAWDQWSKHRAFCSWCMLAAGATWATLPLVVPEALTALRTLRGKAC